MDCVRAAGHEALYATQAILQATKTIVLTSDSDTAVLVPCSKWSLVQTDVLPSMLDLTTRMDS